MPIKEQLKFWGIAAAVFFVLLWWLGNVIMPFLLGGALAYMLDPLADKLERWGMSRPLSVSTIAIFVLLIFVLAVLLIIPTLIAQATQLVQTLPLVSARFQAFLVEQFPEVLDQDSTIRQTLDTIAIRVQAYAGTMLQTALSSAWGVINVLFLLVIVPVVAFYLLLDWDRMVLSVDRLLPREHAETIRSIFRDIDKTLASFIRGQGLVCIILGSYYAIALMLAGLNFGLVIGFVAGIISFIPYVGALVGGVLAIGLAFFQFWGDWWSIAIVIAIFGIGQFVEGNILSPKLVGHSVGLHPVWLILALSVFGSLFGFVGMLVAVPLAAVIGVLMRFFVGKYMQGGYYRGETTDMDDDAATRL